MSQFDKARAEADRIAQEMRDGASKIGKGFQDQFSSGNKEMKYNYPKWVQKLRLVQLVALPLQALALYTEHDRIGLLGFLFPFAVVCANEYLVFGRWRNAIDGRHDVRGVLDARGADVKARHAIQAFGPFVLSLLVYTFAPYIPSSLNSLLFYLSSYFAMATAGAVLAMDSYEAMKNKPL